MIVDKILLCGITLFIYLGLLSYVVMNFIARCLILKVTFIVKYYLGNCNRIHICIFECYINL